jgi:methylphosphotriester-DNA--protein-cysteine methyltransferase
MVNRVTSCEEVWREISNYVDGDVDATLRSTMDEHFRTCQRCASVLAGTRNVAQLYGDERMLEVPAGFSRRLEKRLAQNSAGSGRRWSSWSAWLIPVAALALIAGGLQLTNSLTRRHQVKSPLAVPGQNIPADLVVVVSSGAKIFHVPGCPFIHDKDSERTMTAKEAIHEGYAPCARCLRKYLKTSLTGKPGMEVAEGVSEGEEEREELVSASAH